MHPSGRHQVHPADGRVETALGRDEFCVAFRHHGEGLERCAASETRERKRKRKSKSEKKKENERKKE